MSAKTPGLSPSAPATLLISPPSLRVCETETEGERDREREDAFKCVYVHCIGLYNADGQNESRGKAHRMREKEET